MNVGELGNFISYAFAPASVVAPLGTVSSSFPVYNLVADWVLPVVCTDGQLYIRTPYARRTVSQSKALYCIPLIELTFARSMHPDGSRWHFHRYNRGRDSRSFFEYVRCPS
jgi:hypothetical protein